MEIAWGIAVAQIALLFLACVLLCFSLFTALNNSAWHSIYRKLGFGLMLLASLLVTPMLFLHGLVIGLADHLFVFGPPLVTIIVATGIVARARSKQHAKPQPPAA